MIRAVWKALLCCSRADPRAWTVVSVSMLTALVACNHPSPLFARLVEARALATDLLVQFTHASDASNRAVMADTDAASATFAQEARDALKASERDFQRLDTLVKTLDDSETAQRMAAFRDAFASYKALDEQILGLAVENTNLKAQHLSFGPARQAAEQFRKALEDSLPGAPSKELWRARALVAGAVSAVREIEVLEAPHIAAPEDAAMSDLETQMAAQEGLAQANVRELGELSPELKTAADAAQAALTQFHEINAELIKLSRRNSNVRSLSLALGEKRALTATCEASLQALEQGLERRIFPATR